MNHVSKEEVIQYLDKDISDDEVSTGVRECIKLMLKHNLIAASWHEGQLVFTPNKAIIAGKTFKQRETEYKGIVSG